MNRLQLRIIVGSLALAIVLALAKPAWAQTSGNFGNDAFRFVLHRFSLQPLSQSDWSQLHDNPRQTILIVFGETGKLAGLPGGLKAFIEAGGAALIATDRNTKGGALDEFGVTVDGKFVKARTEASAYRLREFECPLLNRGDSKSPLFRTEPPIATNKPSYLTYSRRDLPDLVWFPADCFIERPDAPGRYCFAAGGELKKGRILIVADHSVFINDMLLQTDNGNLQFAFNCVQWLRDGQDRKRHRVFFIDESTVITDFNVSLQMTPALPASPVEIVNNVIVALEDENTFNRFIDDNIPLNKILSGLAVALTVALIIYGGYRLVRAGYQPETHAPLFTQAVARSAPAVGILDQRQQHMLDDDNLWEPARDLARQCFATMGFDPEPASKRISRSRSAGASDRPIKPQFTFAGSWWLRRKRQAALQRLWRLAYGSRPLPVSQRQFSQLMVQADDLRSAAHAGLVHIHLPGETA
jgi:hypothetical protein